MSPNADFGALSGEEGEAEAPMMGQSLDEDGSWANMAGLRRNIKSAVISPNSNNKPSEFSVNIGTGLETKTSNEILTRFQPNELNSGSSAHKRVHTNHGYGGIVGTSERNETRVRLAHRPAQVLSVGKRPDYLNS